MFLNLENGAGKRHETRGALVIVCHAKQVCRVEKIFDNFRELARDLGRPRRRSHQNHHTRRTTHRECAHFGQDEMIVRSG